MAVYVKEVTQASIVGQLQNKQENPTEKPNPNLTQSTSTAMNTNSKQRG